MALAQWHTTRGTCSESSSHRPRHAPVSAMGHRARRRTALLVPALSKRPVWWRLSAAGQPRLPRVLHRTARTESSPAHSARSPRNIVDELGMLDEHAAAAVRGVPRSAVHRTIGSVAWRSVMRSSSRGLKITIRVRDQAGPAGRVAASTRCTTAGLAAISFGVEIALRRHAAARRTTSHPARAAAAQSSPSCRQRGIATAAFYVFGFLQDDWYVGRGDDRLRHRAGIDGRAVQAPDALPGHAACGNSSRRCIYENGLAEIRRLYANLHASVADDAKSCRFLLGAAYTRFYMRPSCFANLRAAGSRPQTARPVRRSGAQLARAIGARRHGTGLSRADRHSALRRACDSEHASRPSTPAGGEGQLVHGPHIAAFEHAFAAQVDAAHAVTASHGRMAFYYLLEALGDSSGLGDHSARADLLGDSGDHARRRGSRRSSRTSIR